MKENTLIEIGSSGTVILKFHTKTCINNKTYEAGEPYIFLRDVNVLIRYDNNLKTATDKRLVGAYSDIFPTSINISGASFSRRLAALLSTLSEEKESFNISEMKIIRAEDGDGEDNYFFIDNLNAAESVYIYDEDFEKITDFNIEDGMIESAHFEAGKRYTVFFSSERVGAKFDLKKPHTSYMSMEIQGIGNINKETKMIKMFFDKVALNSVINFNFIEDGIINAPLEFLVIKSSENYM